MPSSITDISVLWAMETDLSAPINTVFVGRSTRVGDLNNNHNPGVAVVGYFGGEDDLESAGQWRWNSTVVDNLPLLIRLTTLL